MHSFIDREKRAWNIALDVGTIKRVRAEANIDLLAAASDAKLIQQLSSDAVLLVDVLYVVCRPQCEASNISAESFGRGLAGDAIEHAATALLEELVDFFPSRKAEVLRTAMRKIDSLQHLVLSTAQKEMASIDEQALVDKLFATLGS